MKQVELKKYEIDFRGMASPTALSVNSNSGYSEYHWMEEK